MPDKLLDTAAVASRLGMSRSQVNRVARTGQLPHRAKAPGIRGAYLFALEDVDAFAAARTKAPA
ncbi:helix-turn-helix DNA binding protein [Gordonia phage SallySpecial]|uniref:Helix-turn-helix DNA binding protein n=1 Tax=Gordonia phage SallySpecial TaxID=2079570 RepID=A0A2P1CC03_9CAUD|nr:excisionase and transcriptional regulator [Gordonia phage SallySpecial]AVJ48767.1 helix-turn-helix DNA binding protein [Gordonia phage SallySpecial]